LAGFLGWRREVMGRGVMVYGVCITAKRETAFVEERNELVEVFATPRSRERITALLEHAELAAVLDRYQAAIDGERH
jgi:hypothetical protein